MSRPKFVPAADQVVVHAFMHELRDLAPVHRPGRVLIVAWHAGIPPAGWEAEGNGQSPIGSPAVWNARTARSDECPSSVPLGPPEWTTSARCVVYGGRADALATLSQGPFDAN